MNPYVMNKIRAAMKSQRGALLIYVLIAASLLSSLMAAFVTFQNKATITQRDLQSDLIGTSLLQNKYTELKDIKKFDEVINEPRALVPGTNHEREVIVTEKDVSPSKKQKDVVINVYKSGSSSDPMTLSLLLPFQGSSNSVPPGTILAWYGNLADIPEGYVVCNGSNGTPDLRDKFLVGTGNSYILGNTGGNNSVKISVANLPPTALSSLNGYYVTGVQRGDGTSYWGMEWGRTGQIAKYWGYYGTNAYLWMESFSSLATQGWSGSAIDIRPPFVAVHYIMKS